MEERKIESFSRTTSFQATGQEISITVSFKNCEVRKYERLIPTLDVMYGDLKDELAGPFSRADSTQPTSSGDS